MGYDAYDDFAPFYDLHWGGMFLARYEAVLRDLLVSRVRRDRSVLDLCCGTGQVSRWLTEQGYKVTGIDGSRRMLEFARKNAPGASFLCRDARDFKIVDMFHAALCTFDSVNHITSLLELGSVFNNVYSALRPGGLFIFDINTEEGFKARWQGTASIIAEDHVIAAASTYEPKRCEARAAFAVFRRHGNRWERIDVEILEKAYERTDIERRLAKSLFKNIRVYDAQRDFKQKEVGRLFFVCEK